MKKIFVWVVGIILGLSVLGNIFPSEPSVKGIDTSVTPTVVETTTPSSTPSPTATETPVPTQKPVYIPPTATPTTIPVTTQSSGLSNDNYYTNVDGNEVHSPAYSDSVPAGATAICGDGTYSFSQNRRGTCSHHGGVAEWL